MSDDSRIVSKPSTPKFREGWERAFLGEGKFIGVKREGCPIHIDFIRGRDEAHILELAGWRYPGATFDVIC